MKLGVTANDHLREALVALKNCNLCVPCSSKSTRIDFLVRHYPAYSNHPPAIIQIPINFSLWKMDSTKHLLVTMLKESSLMPASSAWVSGMEAPPIPCFQYEKRHWSVYIKAEFKQWGWAPDTHLQVKQCSGACRT